MDFGKLGIFIYRFFLVKSGLCILFLALFLVSPLWAETSSVAIQDSVNLVVKKAYNIPLPKQSAYTGKGFSVGIAAGVFNPAEECDCLGFWQGQIEYFYLPWLSGGAEVRFFGGDLDADAMVMYQRYQINVKFHLAWPSIDLYLSPVAEFENTDISAIREEWEHRGDWDGSMAEKLDTLDHDSKCEKLFSLDGFSSGIEFGVGWKPISQFGLTSSVIFEHDFTRARLLKTTHGIALNLPKIFDWDPDWLNSVWFSAESGFRKYFNRGVKSWSSSIILGFQLGI